MRWILAVMLMATVAAVAVCASVLSIGNDTWSMGLSENDDDLMTWSAGYTQDIGPGLSVHAGLSSFTDRGSGKGDDFHQGRYDIVDLGVCWGIDSSDWMDMPLSVYGRISAGAALRGNFAGQYTQNVVHRLLGIPGVELPYPDRLSVFPSGTVTAGISVTPLTALTLCADVSGGYSLASPFAGAGISALLSFHGVKGGLSADYVWRRDCGDGICGLWARSITGFGLGFSYDLSFMSFGFRFNPSTGRGYGIFSFEPLRLFESTWERTDVCLRLYKTMMTGLIGFNGTDVAWRLNGWFSPSLRFLYSSGYPNRGQAISESYRMRRNYGIWMVGGELRYQFGFVEISGALHAGFSRWCVDRMMNIDPDPESENVRVADPACPCASVSAGLAFIPEGLVVAGPASVRLYVSGGCMFLTRSAGEALKSDLMHSGWSWHAVDPFLGLGVEFGF